MRCTNCYNCGMPAVTHGGHVHKGNLVLTAGWCNVCVRHAQDQKANYQPCSLYPHGCLGLWNKIHG